MRRLESKVALITGASRGIGKGIAEAFAKEGGNLVLCARDFERLTELVESLNGAGANAIAIAADVTDEQAVANVFHRAMERFGRLDILVNNAGVFDGGPIDQLSVETWDKVMAVNLRGPFLCTREA